MNGLPAVVFRAAMADTWGPSLGNYLADPIRIALFGDVTPDIDAPINETGYGTGVWTAAAEKTATDPADWPPGGVLLTGKNIDQSRPRAVSFTAGPLHSGAYTTLAGATSYLVYNELTNHGICCGGFGGRTLDVTGRRLVLMFGDAEPAVIARDASNIGLLVTSTALATITLNSMGQVQAQTS